MPPDDVGSLPIWDQLRILQEWSPLLSFGQQVLHEKDPYRQTVIVADALEWLAAKTSSKVDDQLIKLVAAVVDTKEGEALVRWAVSQAEGNK